MIFKVYVAAVLFVMMATLASIEMRVTYIECKAGGGELTDVPNAKDWFTLKKCNRIPAPQ